MKRMIYSLVILLLSGCAANSRVDKLEERVVSIENQFDSLVKDHDNFQELSANHAAAIDYLNRFITNQFFISENEVLDLQKIKRKLDRIVFEPMPDGRFFIRATGE